MPFDHRLNRNSRRADERAIVPALPRYNLRTSSAVRDSLRKHSPCPLMTTTGAQRKPGVHVRLVAESPKASKRSHLNPGFKVVSQASHTGGGLFFLLRDAQASRCRVARTVRNLRSARTLKGLMPHEPLGALPA